MGVPRRGTVSIEAIDFLSLSFFEDSNPRQVSRYAKKRTALATISSTKAVLMALSLQDAIPLL